MSYPIIGTHKWRRHNLVPCQTLSRQLETVQHTRAATRRILGRSRCSGESRAVTPLENPLA